MLLIDYDGTLTTDDGNNNEIKKNSDKMDSYIEIYYVLQKIYTQYHPK